MKLTTAQQKVLDEAKKAIDEARAYETYEEYAYNTDYYKERYTFEEALPIIKQVNEEGWRSDYYEEKKRGIVCVTANTRTIIKLAEFGLIEIMDEGGSYPDKIKIINY